MRTGPTARTHASSVIWLGDTRDSENEVVGLLAQRKRKKESYLSESSSRNSSPLPLDSGASDCHVRWLGRLIGWVVEYVLSKATTVDA